MKAQFVFEKFEEESDPIRDMGIGRKHAILKWIDSVYYDDNHEPQFKEFIGDRSSKILDKSRIIIRKDYKIDVLDGWVDFSCYRHRIPNYIQFHTIHGDFSCVSRNFPLNKLPNRITNRLRYFVDPKYYKTYKFSEENIKKYCKAGITDCVEDF